MARGLWIALGALTLAACAAELPAPGLPGVPGAASGELHGAITVDHEAVLRFQADGSQVVDNGPILAGGRLKLIYDPARLPQCRASKYGMPAWSILGYLSWDGGAPQTLALTASGAPLQPVLQVPEAAKKLQVWFYNNDYYGCKAWDSQGGANYAFDVAPPAVPVALRFKADGGISADAPLKQGGLAKLVYAAERLPTCRHSVGGLRAWNLYAGWRFLPGGQSGSAALLSDNPVDTALKEPLVPIPPGATSLELWFSNSDSSGCVAWDSNNSKNHVFPVVPAAGLQVGWAGDVAFLLVSKATQHLGDADPVYYFDNMAGVPLSSYVEVQAWIPGLSDKPYPSKQAAEAAAKAIQAQLYSSAVKNAAGQWTGLPLTFERQQGNNLVWRYRLGDLRWPQSGLQVADGVYPYVLRFSADGGKTWVEAPRADGQPRRIVLSKALDCKMFPDGAPAECPKSAAVGWAGNSGGYVSHACTFKPGLAEPLILTKSAVGHDCMSVTAEVYVPGVTDKDAKPSAVLAEVQTDIGYGGGPLATPASYPLGFDGKVGNNFRFVWHAAQLVGMANKGDYKFRLRFSADGGASWYLLGKGDSFAKAGDPKAAEPAWRNLWVRNDSNDIGEIKSCDGLLQWDGPSASWPTCVTWQPASNLDANACQFYVNAIGRGSFSHNGNAMKWLESYLSVAPAPQTQVLAAGMWLRYLDGSGKKLETLALGKQIEPNYWRSGFTYARSGPGAPTFTYPIEVFAFFVDVAPGPAGAPPQGPVTRYWHSAGGANYSEAAVWAKPGFVLGIGSGSIEYADGAASVFAAKGMCQK